MGIFSDIPVRANGDHVDASWWNTIRSKLILFFGAGTIGETSVNLTNNQSSAASITGLIFASATVKVAYIDFRIRRYTTGGAGSELVAAGTLIAHYKAIAATWYIGAIGVDGDTSVSTEGDVAGVVFSIDSSSGQVQYTTHNQAGSASESLIVFLARTMG